jgi:hypothetical protein
MYESVPYDTVKKGSSPREVLPAELLPFIRTFGAGFQRNPESHEFFCNFFATTSSSPTANKKVALCFCV